MLDINTNFTQLRQSSMRYLGRQSSLNRAYLKRKTKSINFPSERFCIKSIIFEKYNLTEKIYSKMSSVMVICLVFLTNVNILRAQFHGSVGDHVIARWKNNHYYGGKIASISPTRKSVGILFDDGDEITHPLGDVTAVLPDKKSNFIKYYDHVIAPWKGSYKQYIGFVIEMRPNGTFKVLFDDRDEAWYTTNQVRILPQTSSTHEVGARVYARWTNGLYYRGFVSRSASSTVSIRYDDGDKTTLPKNDESAVILDKIPQDFKLEIGQNVIGYWPNRVRYYPGRISASCNFGFKYFVKFADGDERCEAIYEIRAVP